MKKEVKKDNSRNKKYKMIGGIAWFLFMYILLLYYGTKSILFIAILVESKKNVWISYLIVGLIILASSILTKMFIGWIRGLRKLSNQDVHG